MHHYVMSTIIGLFNQSNDDASDHDLAECSESDSQETSLHSDLGLIEDDDDDVQSLLSERDECVEFDESWTCKK